MFSCVHAIARNVACVLGGSACDTGGHVTRHGAELSLFGGCGESALLAPDCSWCSQFPQVVGCQVRNLGCGKPFVKILTVGRIHALCVLVCSQQLRQAVSSVNECELSPAW